MGFMKKAIFNPTVSYDGKTNNPILQVPRVVENVTTSGFIVTPISTFSIATPKNIWNRL